MTAIRTAINRTIRRNSDGRNWCRICGGINKCYPDCPNY